MKAISKGHSSILFRVILGLFTPRIGSGQAVSGNIAGTVTDPSGAAVPDTQVTIKDLDRGLTYQTKTNTDGNYIQTHLLAGHYEVDVQAPGFAAFAAKVVVQVDTTTRVDAVLAVQKAAAEVTVTGEAPLMK